MPPKARIYLTVTFALWVVLAAGALPACTIDSRLPVLALCGIIGSLLKVRLPHPTGPASNISLNFVPVLMAVCQLDAGGVLLVTVIAALVQSLWRPRRKPRPVQVLFNVATLGISAQAAQGAWQLTHSAHTSPLTALLAASVVYYLTNTIVVSAMLALVSGNQLMSIWQNIQLWTLLYYSAGAFVACVLVGEGSAVWPAALFVTPILGMAFLFYRRIVALHQDAILLRPSPRGL